MTDTWTLTGELKKSGGTGTTGWAVTVHPSAFGHAEIAAAALAALAE